MKITVTEYEKKYEFELTSVAQLCGQNIMVKNYIIDSIKKYFGTFKYSEEKNPWRDNVLVDEQQVGRKYFQIISISNVNDLINMVNLSRQSLLLSYLKQFLQDFDCQKSLERIDKELTKIIGNINDNLLGLGNVLLNYSQSDIWDIVQKNDIVGTSGESISELSTYELFKLLFNVITKLAENDHCNYLVICENIDHLINKAEYRKLFAHMYNISNRFEVHFICSLSLDGYPVINRMNISDICVINDSLFQFPNTEVIMNFINSNYPIYKEYTFEDITEDIERMLFRIGKEKYLYSQRAEVFLKMINKSICLDELVEFKQNQVLQAFLES